MSKKHCHLFDPQRLLSYVMASDGQRADPDGPGAGKHQVCAHAEAEAEAFGGDGQHAAESRYAALLVTTLNLVYLLNIRVTVGGSVCHHLESTIQQFANGLTKIYSRLRF